MKKYNLLVPLAGKGQRMVDGGYSFPKPMIMAGDRHILDYGLDSIDYSECNLIFVVRRDHICNFAIDKFLEKYGSDIKIIVAEEDTKGSVSTCLLAKDEINSDIPLIIFCPDIYFEDKFKPTDDSFKHEGLILTFKANSANYSYVCEDQDGFVERTAEKLVISDNASVGVYCFKSGKSFVNLAELATTNDLKTKNEFYICPLYNLLIAGGGKVKSQQVRVMYVMGTPDEMSFFKEVIYPYFLKRKIILCADHSGFETKERIKDYLIELEYDFLDCGTYSKSDCDYSDYIDQAVESKRFFPGALIIGCCRSAQGINMCANKHSGIRSAMISTAEAASLVIRHNAANFFAIPVGIDAVELESMIDTLLSEKFEGGRFQNRLQKLKRIL